VEQSKVLSPVVEPGTINESLRTHLFLEGGIVSIRVH
jgi:hypothetical protein